MFFFSLLLTLTAVAHNKVVVVPLAGDDSSEPEFKTVFITQAGFTGNLDGPTGADDKCQAEADAPGSMVQGKQFMAWVSGDIAGLFTADGRTLNHYDLPYRLVNGQTVANNYADFVDGTALVNDITVTATGTVLGPGGSNVWTGTNQLGQSGPSGETNCDNWLAGDSGQTGLYGRSDGGPNAGGWTLVNPGGANTCNTQSRLYCFER